MKFAYFNGKEYEQTSSGGGGGGSSHTHSNLSVLNTVTSASVHTHSNKTALDSITADKITAWDNAVSELAGLNALLGSGTV